MANILLILLSDIALPFMLVFGFMMILFEIGNGWSAIKKWLNGLFKEPEVTEQSDKNSVMETRERLKDEADELLMRYKLSSDEVEKSRLYNRYNKLISILESPMYIVRFSVS